MFRPSAISNERECANQLLHNARIGDFHQRRASTAATTLLCQNIVYDPPGRYAHTHTHTQTPRVGTKYAVRGC